MEGLESHFCLSGSSWLVLEDSLGVASLQEEWYFEMCKKKIREGARTFDYGHTRADKRENSIGAGEGEG